MARRRLVLVGAGHAHLTTIARLESIIEAGAEVTVLSLGSYQYYSGMGPGLFSGRYDPGKVRFNVRRFSERHGARFVEAQVTAIHPRERRIILADSSFVPYDVISFNIGSVIDPKASGLDACDDLQPVKPVERLFDAKCRIKAMLEEGSGRLVVVGGGAAGVEMAANGAALGRNAKNPMVVTLATKRRILRGFPDHVRRKTLRKLGRLGVRVIENDAIMSCRGGTVLLESGEEIGYDFGLLATGTRPPSLFADSAMKLGVTGGLLVGSQLNTEMYPEIFGGGDCIDFGPRALEKVGVYAVRQNPILYENLKASIQGGPLRSFEPQSRYHLILNYGDGTGLSHRAPFTLRGRLAFVLKHRIDSGFMRKFQECGEAAEIVECPPV